MTDASDRMLKRARDEAGGWIVVLALTTCLGFTVALAWEAYDAGRRHRESAKQVVRQYVSTAAAEFLGRARTQLDYYGLVPAARAVLEWDEDHPDQHVPSVSDLEKTASERQRQGLPLIAGVFRIRSGAVDIGEGISHDGSHAVESDLIKRLNERPLKSSQARVMTFVDDIRLVVTQDGRGGVIGFEIENSVATDFFERAHAGAPLVPSLGDGGLENEEIYCQITDVTGEQLFETGGEWDPYTGVEHTITDDSGEFLSGMRLRVSIDPEAARRIVAGGIPTTRIPLLLAMLAITALLLIMAILQIRRERQLAHLRSDFVSGVSHELRTPLTQIRMFSETLLLGRTRSEEEQRKSLAIIDQESRRLAHLVENILQFSRSERGAIKISRTRIDLSSLIEETIDAFTPVARSRGTRIETRLVARPEADADGDALRQILLNLLDNALKYGPPGQSIVVGLTASDSVARITVEDEGPGVPKERRKQIWDRFYRLENDRNTAVGGSGIGLSVVRELVSLHGGRVSVEDTERSSGACFAVEIPIVDDEDLRVATIHEPAEVR